VILWDAEDWNVRRRLAGHSGTIWTVSFTPDGLRIASGGDDQRVLIWNLSNGKVYVVSDFSSKSIKSRKI
jgi:WD40 repeat protein